MDLRVILITPDPEYAGVHPKQTVISLSTWITHGSIHNPSLSLSLLGATPLYV